MKKYILAIDSGTTSTRAMLFDEHLHPLHTAQQELPQHYPIPGWVEHGPEDIWRSVVETVKSALNKAGIAARDVAALGITNQRETSIIWERGSGKPIYNAIVWQDRRTADMCANLRAEGAEKTVREKTGLLCDPYFSATKIAWLLDNVAGARARAEKGELAFGTVDSFLLWRLTNGKIHATDATNASRTALLNIHTGVWDDELLKLFGVPHALLPCIMDCADDFGRTDAALFGAEIPILGCAGDQQAAAIGQGCFSPGMMKATYGTGCFALLNTGEHIMQSNNRLLGTIACQMEGRRTYALEGAIFVAGAAVQWLRDSLKIIRHASEADALAQTADPLEEVYMVPAFTGLGAPWWDANARGLLCGLTRKSGAAEIAKAALEAACYQTRDLLDAMRADWPQAKEAILRVDGGMSASDFTMQFLADILDAPVERSGIMETTALGAAWLAGYKAGLVNQTDHGLNGAVTRFSPKMDAAMRARKWQGWHNAVKRSLTT